MNPRSENGEQQLPCAMCGAPVGFVTSNPEESARAWADEVVIVWCSACWAIKREGD